MQRIYLDNVATTKVSNEVLTEMLDVLGENFGNPNSPHSFGRDAEGAIDLARDRVAKVINADRGEIYFTSGGTESNNWAIYGLAMANRVKGNHIITSKIEHESVLESCKRLEKQGFKVTYLNVDKTGLVDIAELLHYLDQDTVLVSIMAANNEVGTIENLKAIAKIAHEKGVLFHTDCVQALGNFKLDVKDLDVDAMTLSSHKIHGPKGVGALYVKHGIKIDNLIVGGEQERGKRGGTLNVAGIVGFGKACDLLMNNYIVDCKKMKYLRDYFVSSLEKSVPNVTINGHAHQRIPGLASVTFQNVDGEALMCLLDLAGIAVSTGSACSTGNKAPNYVLLAMGFTKEEAQSTVRFSFSITNTKDEIDYVVEEIRKATEKLRAMSPIKMAKKKV